MGLSFGLGCVFGLSGCDDAASDGGPTTGTTSPGTSTTGADVPLEGDPVAFADGWADIMGNTHNIQGSFFTFADSAGDDADGDGLFGISTIEPATFAGAGATVCAHGIAGQIGKNADNTVAYEDFWGAAIGLNLSQAPDMDPLAFDAMTNNVAGFSFKIEGSAPIPEGGELRFNIDTADDTNNYCAKIDAPGNNKFMLADLHQSCWDATTLTLPTPDPTQLQALHWQYVTKEDKSYDFDLCITELRVIPITPTM